MAYGKILVDEVENSEGDVFDLSHSSLTGTDESASHPASAISTDSGLSVQDEIDSKNKPFVILAMGQSNMAGVTNGTIPAADQVTNDQVYLWDTDATDSDAVVFGTQFNVSTYGTAPLNMGSDGEYCPLIAHSAARFIQEQTGRPVYVVQMAAGGHAIECFIPESIRDTYGWTVPSGMTDYSSVVESGIVSALASVPGSPATYDAFFWHQGENNKADSVELYAYKFTRLVNYLLDTCLDDDTKIVAGELGHSQTSEPSARLRKLNSLVRSSYVSTLSNLRIARSVGLSMISTTDLHFTGSAYIKFGRRFADLTLGGDSLMYDDENEFYDGIAYGNMYLTSNNTEGRKTGRTPVPMSAGYNTIDQADDDLGECFYTEDETVILTTRKLFRVPSSAKTFSVSFSSKVESGTLTVKGAAAQFDGALDWVAWGLSSNVDTTSSDGLVKTTVTFGRSGSGADVILDDSTAFVGLGVSLVNASTATYRWVIDEIS